MALQCGIVGLPNVGKSTRKGFTATFEEFKVTPLADQRRLE